MTSDDTPDSSADAFATGTPTTPDIPGTPMTAGVPNSAGALPAAPVMATDRTSGVVRASSMMAAATLVSRLTGFLAKAIILAFLGAWITADSYNLANTLPNIVFELLIGGVLTSVAIPLLSRARHDPDGGVAYTQRLMTLAVVALAIATAAAMATAPLLIRLYQGSSDNSDPVMATHFAYLLLPQIFFYGVAALFGAILNTKERFAAPVWAPVINNVVVIAVGIMLFTTVVGGTHTDNGMAALSTSQFLLLGVGTTGGIVAQAAVMLPSLRRSGFRFKWRFGFDSRMAEAGRLMGWAIVYTLVSQAGYIVTTQIAYAGPHGYYTVYTYGSMLFQLPYGILGVSLLTAIMPRMSRNARDGRMTRVKHDMSLANRLSTVALLPCTAAMIALAVPLATVTARYGRVTPHAAHILALTLAAFALGLLPLAITLVQMRVFYAMKDGRTPTIINAIMVAVRIPLLLACLWLPDDWVVPGLAGAMSASYVIGVAVGEIWLRLRFGTMGFSRTLWAIARTAVASAAGGLAAWAVVDLALNLTTTSFGGAVLALIIGGIVGLAVVAGGLIVLRVEEARWLVDRFVRRGRGGGDSTGGPSDGTLVGVAAAPSGGLQAIDSSSAVTQEIGQVSVTEPQRHAAFAPGTTVGGRYRLTEHLRTDAAGREYWQARDTVLPRNMAVTLLPGVTDAAPIVTRTLRAGRLHHPGLPQILDVGTISGRTDSSDTTAADTGSGDTSSNDTSSNDTATGHPGSDDTARSTAYIVSPWVDGTTVTQLLAGGPLDPTVAASLTAAVTDAVETAHRSGLCFGALSPELIRVNSDGAVRLSHVVAQPEATEADDIRAAGALLYLLMTAQWPLHGAAPVGIVTAPRRADRELSAAELNEDVPQALSSVAESALHPEDRQGIRAVGALTALLRPAVADAADGAVAQAAGCGDSRPPASPPAGGAAPPAAHHGGGRARTGRAAQVSVSIDRGAPGPTLVRERRIKLGIAGGMIVILVVLMVIVASAIAKQFLTSVAEPIKANDTQPLISTTAPTTTRTVGTMVTTSGSTSGSESSTAPPASSTAPPAAPIKITGAVVYDPQGTPPKDYEAKADLAFDGNTGTDWLTWVYKQQFGPGGIKDGVGLLLSFDHAISPASVTVSTSTSGTGVEIRSTSSADPQLDDTKVLGKAELDSDPVSITLANAPRSKYLIVWVSKLAPYRGDTAANQGQFQSSISEISVTGS